MIEEGQEAMFYIYLYIYIDSSTFTCLRIEESGGVTANRQYSNCTKCPIGFCLANSDIALDLLGINLNGDYQS
jgi:hypothetical protein